MRVYVTGATGFIGSRIVPELLGAGHSVIGLTRSEAGVRQLKAVGADAHLGTLDDADSVAAGARQADAVIHTAFDHDFSHFVQNCAKDERVIAALGAELAGSDRPLIITSGVGMGASKPGQPATEDVVVWDNPNPRVASERAGAAAAAKGVSVAVVRLPQVHDPVKQGLVTPLIAVAREKGVAAYVGEGANRYAAAHVSDVARLYRLAVEQHQPGARYNAADEEGVSTRAIAEAIGAGLGIPVVSLPPEQAEHFGWLAHFVQLDMSASSAWTRAHLGWNPVGPDLISDLRAMNYAA